MNKSSFSNFLRIFYKCVSRATAVTGLVYFLQTKLIYYCFNEEKKTQWKMRASIMYYWKNNKLRLTSYELILALLAPFILIYSGYESLSIWFVQQIGCGKICFRAFTAFLSKSQYFLEVRLTMMFSRLKEGLSAVSVVFMTLATDLPPPPNLLLSYLIFLWHIRLFPA